MKDKRNIVIFVLIIVIACLIGILISNNISKQNKVDKDKKIKNINFNLDGFYQIGEDLKLFDIAFNDSYSNYFGYLYNSDSLDTKDFDIKAALYVSLYKELRHDGEYINIESSVVKENFHKIFGDYLKYQPMSFDAGRVFQFNYNEGSDSYEFSSPGVGGVFFPEIHLMNVSSMATNNSVEVVRKMFYLEYVSNNSGTDITKVDIYKNIDKKDKVGTMNINEKGVDEKKIFKKYGDKLDNYRFRFTKDSIGNYYFEHIEKEK